MTTMSILPDVQEEPMIEGILVVDVHQHVLAPVRVIGAFGDPATRPEKRGGEPAANPHLYLASQIVSGMDGVERGLDPQPAPRQPCAVQTQRMPLKMAPGAHLTPAPHVSSTRPHISSTRRGE